LRELVAAHRPRGERETDARRRILSELDRLDRPCEAGADPVHVTASAVVVGTRGTLLHMHRRLHRWMQPGGHIDPGEAPPEAARRETLEETGLEVAHPPGGPLLLNVDVHEAALGHTHLDLRYLVLGPAEDPAPPPGESQEVRWFDWDAARAIADGALVDALDAARELWQGHRAAWVRPGSAGPGSAGPGPDGPALDGPADRPEDQ
jgi:8-oxo-dGTP pyrophosphatase MutT (NUDIX family)